MNIKLQKKFTERHIDEFVDGIYKNLEKFPDDKYKFDLSETEWISNQNLLLFTSLLKYFFIKGIDFKVLFTKEGISISEITDRTKLQIIQLWEIWEIYSVVNQQDYSNYFDIRYNTILLFKKELISRGKYNERNKEIYNRYGITPFICFNKIENYKDNDLIDYEINPIYKLNEVIEEKLIANNCKHPFINNTLSTIITKELYENFLDHFHNSFFKTERNWAFMSLALKQKNTINNQSLLKINFEEEEIDESISFFKFKNKFKNESIIQFSFLDFGDGIVNTLKDQYIIDNNILQKDLFSTPVDSNEVLKYAFKHNTSRNPILNQDGEKDFYIPRGLFDLLTIVKRYNGLLIVRSNYGKIIYNFSENQDFESAYSIFGDSKKYFPGTFISIYLPALANESEFDKSVIKPIVDFQKIKIDKNNYINIFTLTKKIKKDKEHLYNDLLNSLKNELNKESDKNKLNYISFLGCKDERVIKKIIFALLTDYNINLKNNIIILHPPEKELLKNINDEILSLNSVVKDFKIHPIPFVNLNDLKDNVEVDWIGIYDENDKQKLNQFLFENVILPVTDFNDHHNILGNLHYSDSQGNVHSQISKTEEFLKYYKRYSIIDDILIEDIILENNCIKEDGLYLCNGNYYQSRFLQLIDLLNNKEDCDEITQLLFKKIKEKISGSNDIHYLAITSSSHKILYSLIGQGLIEENKCLFFDSYITFENDPLTKKLKPHTDYILVCDAISGGNLTRRIARAIDNVNSKLINIAVIANTIDENFENTKDFISEFHSKIIHLYKFPIEKKRRDKIIDKELLKNVIRINPYTNIPITFSENSTLKETILLSNSEFCNFISTDDININFKIFNNLLHPYFFNLQSILSAETERIKNNESSILKEIFKKLEDKIEINDDLKIFLPKRSDIKSLDFEIFKSKILLNQSIEIYELERFNIDEGWKFPHTTDYYSKIVENKNILIFDDGSCSGDSLLQMINELTSFKPKKIDLLCIVGRVSDHKREFFSKINSLKYNVNEKDPSKKIEYKEVNVNIYFGSHWHISTFYLDNSPYSDEINWLKDLLKIQNAPLSIRNIAGLILNEIVPKGEKSADYKYLPKQKKDGIIPKIDLIIVRNEIGKIIGHRFYKENFVWFNDFITKYEKRERSIDRTKDIEILCMCMLYEPYLYDRISNFLPDVREKMEEFIDSIIIGNPKNNNKKIDIKNELYFDWKSNKKDIIHLFFIIYKGENLINKLSVEIFTNLLEFSKDAFKKTNSINYIFYKFLRFFPLNKSEISTKNSSLRLKNFFYEVIESGKIDPKNLSELKRFYSFINTLPNGEGIEFQIDKIKNIYWEHEQPKAHDNRESFDQNISRIITNLSELKDLCESGEKLDLAKIDKVKESWWNIKHVFLDNIIAFYRTFEDFFKPYPYHLILSRFESKNNSLIEMYAFLDDFLFNILQKGNDLKNFNISIEFIEIIQLNFGLESEFRDIFENPETSFNEFKEKFISAIKLVNDNLDLTINCNLDLKISIPCVYVEKLIINELKENLNFYSDKEKNISMTITSKKDDNDFDFIEIEIINYFTENIKEFSSNEGLNGLKLLSESSLFNFNFNYLVDNDNKIFKQYLKFKK